MSCCSTRRGFQGSRTVRVQSEQPVERRHAGDPEDRDADDHRRRDRAPVQPAHLHRQRGQRLDHDPGGPYGARRCGERRVLGRAARERRGGNGVGVARTAATPGPTTVPAERHAQLRSERHEQDLHDQALQGRPGRGDPEGRRPRAHVSPAWRRGASRAARGGRTSRSTTWTQGGIAQVERCDVLGQRGVAQGRPHRQPDGGKRGKRDGRLRDRGRCTARPAGRRLRRPLAPSGNLTGTLAVRRERDVPDARDPDRQGRQRSSRTRRSR